MTDKISDSMKEVLVSKIAMGKLGTGEDVANSVVFLSSDASSWITGQNILVSGGRTHRTVQYQDEKSTDN